MCAHLEHAGRQSVSNQGNGFFHLITAGFLSVPNFSQGVIPGQIYTCTNCSQKMHPERAVRKVTIENDVDWQPSHSFPGLGRVCGHSLRSYNIWGGVPRVSTGVGPHIIRSTRNPISSTDGGGRLAVSRSVAKVIKPTMRAHQRQRPVREK